MKNSDTNNSDISELSKKPLGENVLHLGKVKLVEGAPPPVNDNVVQYLREALRDAKSGKIQAIALGIAYYDPEFAGNKGTRHIYAFADGYEYAMRCALENLKFRLQMMIEIQADPVEREPFIPEDE